MLLILQGVSTILLLLMAGVFLWVIFSVGFSFKFNVVLGLFVLTILSALWWNWTQAQSLGVLFSLILAGLGIIFAAMSNFWMQSPSNAQSPQTNSNRF